MSIATAGVNPIETDSGYPTTPEINHGPENRKRRKCDSNVQNPDFLRFAHECHTIRTYIGWSQNDVAIRAGISRAAVAKVEAGARVGSADTLLRIARVLKLDPMYLCFEAGPVTCRADLITTTTEDEE